MGMAHVTPVCSVCGKEQLPGTRHVAIDHFWYCLDCASPEMMRDTIEQLQRRAEAAEAERDGWKDRCENTKEVNGKLRAYVDRLTADRDRLRRVVEEAPHGQGCPTKYSKDAPQWMRPGTCDCWKRAALEAKE